VQKKMKRALNRAFVSILLVGITFFSWAGGKKEASFIIEIEDLQRIIKEESIVILDIRDELSYLRGHIPGAILAPLSEINSMAADILASKKKIVTYCSCPAEESSMDAAFQLRERGGVEISVLKGGYPAWAKAGFDVVIGPEPM
jgi:rhodanese-related sulfurtransferase